MPDFSEIVKARVEPEIKAALLELQSKRRECEAVFIREALREYLERRGVLLAAFGEVAASASEAEA